MNRAPILFVHIPKTAGISLKSLLRSRCDHAAYLDISEGWPEWPDLVTQVDAYDLIAGHVGYGIVNAFQRRPAVVTFLRDPIERAVSAYYFLRQIDDSHYATRFQGAERRRREHTARRAKELCLLDFIRSEPQIAAPHLGNVQTWYLSSNEIRRRPFRELRADDLQAAKKNLEQCHCFGLVERVDESMTMLSHTLGWEPFAGLPHANSTRARPSVTDLDKPTLDSLRDLTRLDGELYRFATLLFERRWQVMRAEVSTRNPLGTPLSMGAEIADDPIAFTFDRAIPGNGWYGAERIANRWCSWTGPGCDAWINLKSAAHQDAVLRVNILHALKPEVLQRTQLLINDTPLTARVGPDTTGHVIKASLPKSLMAINSGEARIMIRVPEVLRPCDLDPTNADSRQLGLLVAGITLVPAA